MKTLIRIVLVFVSASMITFSFAFLPARLFAAPTPADIYYDYDSHVRLEDGMMYMVGLNEGELGSEDYGEEEEGDRKKAIFKDKVNKFESSFYWEVNTQNSTERAFLLKGDRIANHLENSRGPFLLEIGNMPYGVHTNVLYIPESVIHALEKENREFRVDIGGMVFGFRPKSLDVLETREAKVLKNAGGVKEVLVEIRIAIKGEATTGIHPGIRDAARDVPKGKKPVSPVVELELKVSGMSRTYDEIKNMMEKRLHDTGTGLVPEKEKYVANFYKTVGPGSDEFELYVEGLVWQIEKELAVFAQNILYWSMARDKEPVDVSPGSPINITIPVNYINYNSQGLITPYVKYAGMGSEGWLPVLRDSAWYDPSFRPSSYVRFNVTAPGKYVLLADEQPYYDLPGYYPGSDHIWNFISKYDVSKILNLSGGYLYPGRTVSVKEAVLLCGLVVGENGESYGLDLKEMAKRLGLDGIISVSAPARDITRQEAAGLIMKMYSAISGIEYEKLRPSSNFHIADEKDISDKYHKAVLVLVGNNIMELDDNRYFNPLGSITRGEMLAAMSILALDTPGAAGDMDVGSYKEDRFDDISSSLFREAINKVASAHDLKSVKGKLFYTGNDLTVADAVKFILDVMDYNYGNNFIESAYRAGIVDRTDAGNPTAGCTREKALFMAARLYELKTGEKAKPSGNRPYPFKDMDKISPHLADKVIFAIENGFMSDRISNMLEPGDVVMRGEFMGILEKVLEACGEL